jgi:hypothetical protein
MDQWAHYHPLGGAKPNLQTALPAEEPTYLPYNCHPTTPHHYWMARRCRGWSADVTLGRPTPPASPLPHLCLQVPHALYTL